MSALLYAGYANGTHDWLHAEHVFGSRYLISTVPLHGTIYSFLDLVEAKVSRGRLYIARIVRPSDYRTVRFNRLLAHDPRFRARALQIDALECIIEWTDQGHGSIAYRGPASIRLGRILRQMESEGLLRVLDDLEYSFPLASQGIA